MDTNLSNSMFHIFVNFIPEVTISSSDIGHVIFPITKLIELNYSLYWTCIGLELGWKWSGLTILESRNETILLNGTSVKLPDLNRL